MKPWIKKGVLAAAGLALAAWMGERQAAHQVLVPGAPLPAFDAHALYDHLKRLPPVAFGG